MEPRRTETNDSLFHLFLLSLTCRHTLDTSSKDFTGVNLDSLWLRIPQRPLGDASILLIHLDLRQNVERLVNDLPQSQVFLCWIVCQRGHTVLQTDPNLTLRAGNYNNGFPTNPHKQQLGGERETS